MVRPGGTRVDPLPAGATPIRVAPDRRPRALVLIEPGETHEIANTGSEPLATINVYAPPEY